MSAAQESAGGGNSRVAWLESLRAPVVAAPMFLVTSPAIVTASCRVGIAAVIPALNAESTQQLDAWLGEIRKSLAETRSTATRAWGVNLIGHATNKRFNEDLAVVVAHKAPLVVSSVGSPRDIVAAVHEYGGAVFSDVIHIEHARKAAQAGVDGLVLICAGAGGNTGWINPFAFLKEVRTFFKGVIAVAGGITDGAQVRALQSLGADLAYIGTPFIATAESDAGQAYKEAVAASALSDIVLSNALSGLPANVMKVSLQRMGVTGRNSRQLDVTGWGRSVAWSAGHGIGAVSAIESCEQLVSRLVLEYEVAVKAG
ncbi:nitronate monooxygenase [Variovorax humicola]|uniref:Nitronate monooxygenase n=1 Tax=Variovorax humicola TaxID=1769758 RepID=A0ABU8W359_9BURK